MEATSSDDNQLDDSVKVVLVEPAENLNIGSVARAMGNLGFSHLVLVNPVNYIQKRALITACHGDFVVNKIIIVDSLAEAISDVTDVVGFTGTTGLNRHPALLKDWVKEIVKDQCSGVASEREANDNEESAAPQSLRISKTALVFGPEDNGLRVEHLEQCRLHVRIPSFERCFSYNLSQAVLLALYELRTNLEPFFVERKELPEPTYNEFFQLDRLITSALTLSEFYRQGTPEPVPRVVMNMFRRIKPNAREMGILLGLWSRIERELKRRVQGMEINDKEGDH